MRNDARSAIGTDIPPAGILATGQMPAPVDAEFTNRPSRRFLGAGRRSGLPIASRTICEACSMLCRSRSSEWSTNENSRFRATRFDRKPPPNLRAKQEQTRRSGARTQGCNASLHRRIANRLAFRSRRLADGRGDRFLLRLD